MKTQITAKIIGLDEDLKKEEKRYLSLSENALQFVGAEMVLDLQKHIKEDWYEKWGEPLVYRRRTDNPSYGTPLGSEENMTYDKERSGNQVEFVFGYFPNGEHNNPLPGEDWHSADGNDLIKIIQENEGWKYPVDEDTQGRTIMPRPFWDNFVEEQKTKAVDSFIKGMQIHDPDIKIQKEPTDFLEDLEEFKL